MTIADVYIIYLLIGNRPNETVYGTYRTLDHCRTQIARLLSDMKKDSEEAQESFDPPRMSCAAGLPEKDFKDIEEGYLGNHALKTNVRLRPHSSSGRATDL